eukprot:s956_g2.t1
MGQAIQPVPVALETPPGAHFTLDPIEEIQTNRRPLTPFRKTEWKGTVDHVHDIFSCFLKLSAWFRNVSHGFAVFKRAAETLESLFYTQTASIAARLQAASQDTLDRFNKRK